MKWSSPQPRRDGLFEPSVAPPGDSDALWLAPAEHPEPVWRDGDPDHRVREENRDASHISLRTVDSALRHLTSLGYIR